MLTGQVSDIFNIPGGLQPTTTTRSANGTIDREGFLKLLVAQIKNQDPTSPMDNEKFTQQLTDFSSLDELIGMNKSLGNLSTNLEGLSTLNDTLQDLAKLGDISQLLQASLAMQQSGLNASAVSLIGREIRAESNQLEANGQPVQYEIGVPPEGQSLKITIEDSQGHVVKQDTVDPSNAADLEAHGITRAADGVLMCQWDGKVDGQAVTSGTYKVKVSAGSDNPTDVPVYVRGVVSGVDFTGQETMIELGSRKIRMADVVTIRQV